LPLVVSKWAWPQDLGLQAFLLQREDLKTSLTRVQTVGLYVFFVRWCGGDATPREDEAGRELEMFTPSSKIDLPEGRLISLMTPL
jgi:hypothetical protein